MLCNPKEAESINGVKGTETRIDLMLAHTISEQILKDVQKYVEHYEVPEEKSVDVAGDISTAIDAH